jgi:hypothetical protein
MFPAVSKESRGHSPEGVQASRDHMLGWQGHTGDLGSKPCPATLFTTPQAQLCFTRLQNYASSWERQVMQTTLADVQEQFLTKYRQGPQSLNLLLDVNRTFECRGPPFHISQSAQTPNRTSASLWWAPKTSSRRLPIFAHTSTGPQRQN